MIHIPGWRHELNRDDWATVFRLARYARERIPSRWPRQGRFAAQCFYEGAMQHLDACITEWIVRCPWVVG